MATIPVSGRSELSRKSANAEAPPPNNLPHFRPLSSQEDVVVCGVIGPTNINEVPACPCCNRRVSGVEERQTLDEPASTSRGGIPCVFNFDVEQDEGDDTDDEDDDDVYLPGTLDSGVEYKFKRVLAEGWIHKKGTGNDWLHSRAWKTRWAQLVLAKVDGFAVDVPLLIIYWYPLSAPSTVIMLDSTVVVPVDNKTNSKSACNPYQFDVIHAKDGESSSERVKRTFSVPHRGRDEWVYAINSALLKYEKDKAQARREAAALTSLSRPTGRNSSYTKILEDECYKTLGSDFTSSPVSSPPRVFSPPRVLSPPPLCPRSPSSPKRPLPRPATECHLMGESLLDSLQAVRPS